MSSRGYGQPRTAPEPEPEPLQVTPRTAPECRNLERVSRSPGAGFLEDSGAVREDSGGLGSGVTWRTRERFGLTAPAPECQPLRINLVNTGAVRGVRG
jgi:hypothetical protein